MTLEELHAKLEEMIDSDEVPKNTPVTIMGWVIEEIEFTGTAVTIL